MSLISHVIYYHCQTTKHQQNYEQMCPKATSTEIMMKSSSLETSTEKLEPIHDRKLK